MIQQTARSLKDKAMDDLDAGKFSQALKKAQLGVKKFPKDADYHAILGFALIKMKRYKQCIPHFAEAARLKPKDPQFSENIANALMQTGQVSRALNYAESKLEQFPNNSELQRVIREIELKGGNWREIIDYASERLKSDPDNTALLMTRSRAYAKVAYLDKSTKDIERAFALEPENVKVAYLMAVNLHRAGQKEECTRILQDILTRQPDHMLTLSKLAAVAGKADAPELLRRVDEVIAASDEVPVHIAFAKADLLSKSAGLEAALPHYARANASQHASDPYDTAYEEKKFDLICQMFPADQPLPEAGVQELPLPIFVIGQPRSGTTLMEMMLSSAEGIEGCGELSLGTELSHPFIEDGEAFTAQSAGEFAQRFRTLMPPLPEGTTAFVDKMPHNFQRVGFLLAAFPNARVINMLRDPRDVGLSKWIRHFPAPGMRYASKLEAIAHSANMYRRYMTHWDRVFGVRILTVPYEALVADPETHSRAVADFCGIEWHARMMHPEKNTKQVHTASIDQVRKKISTKSIGGWRSVAAQIAPMIDGFDPDLWPEYAFT